MFAIELRGRIITSLTSSENSLRAGLESRFVNERDGRTDGDEAETEPKEAEGGGGACAKGRIKGGAALTTITD